MVKPSLRDLIATMKARSESPEFEARVRELEKVNAALLLNEREDHRRRSGIPAAFWGLLDEPRETEALAVVRRFCASDHRWCVLSGQIGRGKSVAMAWAVDRRGGRFVEAFDLCRLGMFSDDDWDDLRLAPLLAVDELGAEPRDEKGWFESKLYALFNGRYQDGRRTLIASNLTPGEMRKRYGVGDLARLWDRIEKDMVSAVLTGPSMRGA